MAELGKFFLALTIGGLRTLADAWGFMMLWGWFVVPLGLPAITFWHAVGLDLFVGMVAAFMAPRRPDDQRDYAEDMAWSAVKIIIAPFAVGVAWIVQGAM